MDKYKQRNTSLFYVKKRKFNYRHRNQTKGVGTPFKPNQTIPPSGVYGNDYSILLFDIE